MKFQFLTGHAATTACQLLLCSLVGTGAVSVKLPAAQAQTRTQQKLRFPVVPGQSVGRVRLGDTQMMVRQKMGKPAESRVRSDGLQQDTWLGPQPKSWPNESQRSFVVIYKNGKVAQIEYNSPHFVTARGISTRSSLQRFRARHRRLQTRAYSYTEGGGGHVEYYYDHLRHGICFQLGTQDFFDARVTPETLRVHPRNMPVIITPNGQPARAVDEKPIDRRR
jgi:hypothetical protein